AQRAVAANPNDADSHAVLAIALTYGGRATEAVAPLEHAMRLDPLYPPTYLSYLGTARFALGQLDDAVALFVRAVKRNPENALMPVHLAAAYGLLGRQEDAAATLAELNRLRRASGIGPYTISTARRLIPYRLAADRDRLIQGLRAAGVPE